jgi:DNA polymerase (family X)
MTTLDASAVAALLREFGRHSALREGNPFRAKAYTRAADNLLALSLPLDQVIAQDRLREIPGVGNRHRGNHQKTSCHRNPPRA